MTLEKIDDVLVGYMVKLEDLGIERKKHSPSILAHAHWMCMECRGWLCEEKRDKVMRWLGFIQGVLCAQGIYTIEELKAHNKPE